MSPNIFVDLAKQIQAGYDVALSESIENDARSLFKDDQDLQRAHKEKRIAFIRKYYSDDKILDLSREIGEQLAMRLYNAFTIPAKRHEKVRKDHKNED